MTTRADDGTISIAAARYRALAASGAAVITFIGACHEVVGAVLFPWGPAFVGGPLRARSGALPTC